MALKFKGKQNKTKTCKQAKTEGVYSCVNIRLASENRTTQHKDQTSIRVKQQQENKYRSEML